MKNIELDKANQTEVIAYFGSAKIIQTEGRFALQGGSAEDRRQAKEWAARFLDVRFSEDVVLSAVN